MRPFIEGKTKLAAWIERQTDPQTGDPITVAEFARLWGVSTLWLIAQGRVRASYANGMRIQAGTCGAITLHDVCDPDGELEAARPRRNTRARRKVVML